MKAVQLIRVDRGTIIIILAKGLRLDNHERGFNTLIYKDIKSGNNPSLNMDVESNFKMVKTSHFFLRYKITLKTHL